MSKPSLLFSLEYSGRLDLEAQTPERAVELAEGLLPEGAEVKVIECLGPQADS